MSAEPQQKLDRDHVLEVSESRDEPDWLTNRRLEAWESYEDLPFPKVITTPGKVWTDLGELTARSLAKGEGTTQRQIETNEADLPEGVVLTDFETALEEHEDLVRENLMNKAVRWDDNRFTAIHAAAVTDGVFVYVPEGVEVDEILSTQTVVDDTVQFSHTLVVVEDNAKVNVSESIEGGDESYFSNIVEVHAGDGAEVNYGAVQDLSEDSYQYTVKRGTAGRDASVNWIDGCFGTALTKSTVSTVIEGEGADTENLGLFFGTGDQHFDVETRTRHDAPNSVCDMFTRGVLDDEAVGAYEGTIEVSEPAYNVDAYQTENVLLVSDKAEADASPRLEIDNNDVKCSHAATVGRIDDEEMFYMRSRGLDEETVRRRIVEGFFEPVFGELPLEELEDDCREIVERKMEI
ncbi:Fe-S cluster assembly protein SufD [Halorutilales archaeon Cl-col2-1]